MRININMRKIGMHKQIQNDIIFSKFKFRGKEFDEKIWGVDIGTKILIIIFNGGKMQNLWIAIMNK